MIIIFKNRNFSLLFLGRLISNIGDSMYSVAGMWLVYKLGGSAFYSGLAGFLIMLPQSMQFLIGPVIDRHSEKKILIMSQLLQGILIGLLVIFYRMDVLSIEFILIVMPIASLLEQFSFPSEKVLIPKIVNKSSFVKANSILTIANQGTTFVFNAISGILVSSIGAIFLFATDSITFFICAILFTLISIGTNEQRKQIAEQHINHGSFGQYYKDLVEGFDFIFKSFLGKLLIAASITNFTYGAMIAILPAYANLFGDAKTYGYLLAGISVSMLIGASSAQLWAKLPFGKILIMGYFATSLLWIISPSMSNLWLKIILFALSMLPLGSINVLTYSMMQNVIPTKFLARSVTVIMSVSSFLLPLGSLLGGYLGAIISPKIVFTLAGFGFLFISCYVLLIPELRRLSSVDSITNRELGIDDTSI